MKSLFGFALIAIMPFSTLVAHAESEKTAATANAEKFQMIHVPELQKQLADKANPTYIFDANNQETRAKDGIIPGAKLLANSTHYATTVLPANKDASLVFYCANTECTASHSAAKRAIEAGYKKVSVFADGIEGWKKAGLKTDKI